MKAVSSRRGRWSLGSTLVAAALVVSACGSDSQDSGNSSTLTVDMSFTTKSLDPGQGSEQTGLLTIHAAYDTLLTFKGADVSKPVPDLAKSYTASDDDKTFTFILDPAAVFSDGTPVTSADVVFSLNRLKNLKGSPSSDVQNLSFSATDEHTVVVSSTVSDPAVPTILTEGPASVLNSKVAKEHGGTDAADASTKDTLGPYLNTHSIGSGPYQIESADFASRIVLTTNPKYWATKPTFSRVVIQNMNVDNQKLTMSKLPKSELALDLEGNALVGLPSELQISQSWSGDYELRMNTNPSISKVTSNADWVAALQAAVDYPGVAALFGPKPKVPAGIVPFAYAGALPESEAQTRDLDKAKSLLAQSGVGDQTVSLLYPAISYNGVDLGDIVAKIQRDAAEAGIKIQLDPAPIASFLAKQPTSPFTFAPYSPSIPLATSIVTDLMPGGGAAKRVDWTADRADPATVAAAKAVLDARDPATQVSALQDWQRLMMHHSPYIVVAAEPHSAVASSDLKNVEFSPAGWLIDVQQIGVS